MMTSIYGPTGDNNLAMTSSVRSNSSNMNNSVMMNQMTTSRSNSSVPNNQQYQMQTFQIENNPRVELMNDNDSSSSDSLPTALMIVMIVLICFQLPFMITNLVFSYTEPTSVCMDGDFDGLVVRSWLRGIGYAELSFIAQLLLYIILGKAGCVSGSCVICSILILLICMAVKELLWTIMVYVLYFKVVDDNCTGGIHSYFIALMVLMTLSLIAQCCNGRNQKQ